MRQFRTAIALVGPLVLAAAAVFPARAAPPDTIAAPVFSVRTLEGKIVRLSDFRGKAVLLDFWATWCAPCRVSMPHLDTLQQRYRDQGLVVLGLSLDDGDPQTVRRFADRLRVRFRLAMANEKVLDLYGPIRSLPTTIFINRKGQVVRRVLGYIDAETMEAYARELF